MSFLSFCGGRAEHARAETGKDRAGIGIDRARTGKDMSGLGQG